MNDEPEMSDSKERYEIGTNLKGIALSRYTVKITDKVDPKSSTEFKSDQRIMCMRYLVSFFGDDVVEERWESIVNGEIIDYEVPNYGLVQFQLITN